MTMRWATAAATVLTAVTAMAADYQYKVEIASLPRGDKPSPPRVGNLWLPEGVKTVRGLLFGGKTMLEGKVCGDGQVRAACAEKGLGVLYFDPALDAVFDYVRRDSAEKLEQALAELAKKAGHPEIEFAPLLTVGHSTGGIFCRNVAYWKPHRVIGVIHIMSGNLQAHVPDRSSSLAGVPFMAINGEFEEYGPDGGDLGKGLRSEYSLNDNKLKQNQSQWVMVRMQLITRRQRNGDNLMSLVVHRGRGHTGWSDDMSALCAQFIRSACDARMPKDAPDGKTEVRCRTVKAADGWLTDADIKDPKHKPAAWADYAGDKALAFWHADKAMAEAVAKYRSPPWAVADPTAGQSPAKRYSPPPNLSDLIDAPPPRALHWTGEGAWDANSANWVEAAGKPAEKWNPACQAVLGGTGKAGSVAVGARMSCTGLKLGKGCTLALGAGELRVDWHAELADGSAVSMALDAKDAKRRAGRLQIDGNAKLGGELAVMAADELPAGTYPLVTISGRVSGSFGKVTAPADCTVSVEGGTVVLKKTTASPAGK